MQARQFISGYSEAAPSTVGSVLVQDLSNGGQYSATDSATVHFRPIPEATIEQLIQEGTVFYCAGAPCSDLSWPHLVMAIMFLLRPLMSEFLYTFLLSGTQQLRCWMQAAL